MTLDSCYAAMQERVEKGIKSFEAELAKIRAGRAHPQLLDHIKVSSYGGEMPLAQMASIHTEGARTLLVTPWDKSQVAACEKAIRMANLGLNPATQGQTIRVPLPALTEERRRDLIKLVKDTAEGARVTMRNARRSALQELKQMLKDKLLSEDEEKGATTNISKMTQEGIDRVESLLESKQHELAEIG